MVSEPSGRMVSTGSFSVPPSPKAVSEGPLARIRSFFGSAPLTTKPVMSALAPVPTEVPGGAVGAARSVAGADVVNFDERDAGGALAPVTLAV